MGVQLTKKELFTTYNLNLSSVFVAMGLKLANVEKNPSGKSLFCFEHTKKLDEINEKYWRKELLCEPQLLFDSAKFLKNRLYSEF
jgi:hypothetical protein